MLSNEGPAALAGGAVGCCAVATPPTSSIEAASNETLNLAVINGILGSLDLIRRCGPHKREQAQPRSWMYKPAYGLALPPFRCRTKLMVHSALRFGALPPAPVLGHRTWNGKSSEQ